MLSKLPALVDGRWGVNAGTSAALLPSVGQEIGKKCQGMSVFLSSRIKARSRCVKTQQKMASLNKRQKWVEPSEKDPRDRWTKGDDGSGAMFSFKSPTL